MSAARDSPEGISEQWKGDEFTIVEGWGEDEDEDVNIDSDGEDDLQSVLAGCPSSQLRCSGIGRRLELTVGISAGSQDSFSRNERGPKSPNVARSDSVRERDGLGFCAGGEQLRDSADLRCGQSANETAATASKLASVDSGYGGCSMDAGGKRLDAKRFRREFSAKISESNIPVRSKKSVPDVGRMVGSTENDVNKWKKSSQERDVGKGVQLKGDAAAQLFMESVARKEAEILVAKKCDGGRKNLPNERGRQSTRLWQLKVQGIGETVKPLGKHKTRKRKFEKLELEQQTSERKSTRRNRAEISKQDEDRPRRLSGGEGYSRSPVKTKQEKKEEERSLFQVSWHDDDDSHRDTVNRGYSETRQKKSCTDREEDSCRITAHHLCRESLSRGVVGEAHSGSPLRIKHAKDDGDISPVKPVLKWSPPETGALKAFELPATKWSDSVCESGCSQVAVGNRKEMPQVNKQRSSREEKLQLADLKVSDVEASPEVFELELLGKVFERRLTRSKEKRKRGISDLQGGITETPVMAESMDNMARISGIGSHMKVRPTLFERHPTRSADMGRRDHKCQQPTETSSESLHGKLLCERGDGGKVFRRRSTRSSTKAEVNLSPNVESLGTLSSELGEERLMTADGIGCIARERREVLVATDGVVILREEKDCLPPLFCKIDVSEEYEKGLVASTVESGKKKVDFGKSKVVNEELTLSGKRKHNLELVEIVNKTKVQHSLGKKGDAEEMWAMEQSLKEISAPDAITLKLATLEAGDYQSGASSVPSVGADMRAIQLLNEMPLKQKYMEFLEDGEIGCQASESLEDGEIGRQGSDSNKRLDTKFIMTEDLPEDELTAARSSGSVRNDNNEENLEKVASAGMKDENLEYFKLDQAPTDSVPRAGGIHYPDEEGSLKAKEDVAIEGDGDSTTHPRLLIQTDGEWMDSVKSTRNKEPRKQQPSSKPSAYGVVPSNSTYTVNSPKDGNHGLGLQPRSQLPTTMEECHSRECLATGLEIQPQQGWAIKFPVEQGRLSCEVLVDCVLSGEEGSDSENWKANDHHNSFCESCRHGGELLCCDGSGCSVTYHLECTDPKLLEVPSGNWYCPTCAHKRLSYGVHAVSKLVESIWDVRDSGQSSPGRSASPSIFVKDVVHLGPDEESGRFNGPPQKDRDGAEGKVVVLANVAPDEEGINGVVEDGTSFGTLHSRRVNRTANMGLHVRGEAERRQWADGGRLVERNRKMDKKTAIGKFSSSVQVNVFDESRRKEYLVKWRGISHVHNTWVAERELTKISPKVLAKFKRKLMEGQAPKWNSEWAEPQRLVDRRLATPPRQLGGGRGRGYLCIDSREEWFVKWKGLGYEQCTWEPVDSGVLSDAKARALEVVFNRWCESSRKRVDPLRVEEVRRFCEGTFKQLESQPEWLQGGQLLTYQLERLNLLRRRWHHHQNTILVGEDDQQDKLSTVIPFLLSLTEEYGVYKPILVIVPVFEIQNWEAEVSRNAYHVNTVVYTGVKEARGVIQRFELNRSDRPLRVQILLTTHEVASSDSEYLNTFKWEAVIVNEGQNSKITKSHGTFSQFDAGFRLLLVNDLRKCSVEELRQIRFFVAPQNSTSNSDLHQILIGLDNSEQVQYLYDQLSGHIVMNNKPDIVSGLELREYWVGAQMTLIQVHLYCNALTRHYHLLHSGRLRMDPDSPSLHDFMTQLRLCCQHPYHIDPTLEECIKQDLAPSQSLVGAGIEVSGKLQLLDRMLSVFHAEGRRVLILSQFLLQLYLLDDYMRQKYGLDSYEMVDTRHSALKKNKAVQRFNAKDSSRFVFLLRTGASGLSLKLRSMDTVIIHDSDLNPANDLEYVRKAVYKVDGELKVYRLYHHFSVEEGSMVYAHQKKLEPDAKPLTAKFLQQVLRWKVQSLFELDTTSSTRTILKKMKQISLPHEKGMLELEHAKNILQGADDMEAIIENLGHEVLGEEDGEAFKEFWSVLLKERHVELQDREEQSSKGKGLRQRKRVQYSEEVLALAPYSVVEEEVKRRKRKPQICEAVPSSGLRDKSRQASLQSSPSTPLPVEIHSKENAPGNELVSKALSELHDAERPEIGVVGNDKGYTSQNGFCKLVVEPSVSYQVPMVGVTVITKQFPVTVGQVFQAAGAIKSLNEALTSIRSCDAKKEDSGLNSVSNLVNANSDKEPVSIKNVSSAPSQGDNGRKLRMEQKQQLLLMEPELSQICKILQVPDNIACYAHHLLSHVMNSFRMPKEPKELVVMVEISLCLVAAAHCLRGLEHLPAVCEVGEKLELSLKEEEFESVYKRLEVMCKTHATFPSAKKGAETETILAQIESSLHTMPTSGASEQNPTVRDSSLSEPREQPGQTLLGTSALPSSLPSSQQFNALTPYSEEKSSQTQLAYETGLQPTDFIPGQSDLVMSNEDDEDLRDCHVFEESVSVDPQHLPLQTEAVIHAKLKLDKDEFLQTCLAKQKLEVAEFYLIRRKEREALEEKFEKQRSFIMEMNCDQVQKTEMLRLQADTFASDLKLYDKETEVQLSDMNNKQRLVRDKVNASYTRLLQEVSPGSVPDLFAETQSVGLTFSLRYNAPNQQGSILTSHVEGHPLSPVLHQNQGMPSDSWPQPQPQPRHQCQIPSASHLQLEPHLQPESQLMLQAQSQEAPLIQTRSQAQPQHLESPSSSQVGAGCQSQTRAICKYNIHPELSALQEQTVVQPEYLHLQRCMALSHQLTMETQERLWARSSHRPTPSSSQNVLGSELVPGIIPHQLESTWPAVEQQTAQSSTTQQPRVSQATQLSIGFQTIVSQNQRPRASIHPHQHSLWNATSLDQTVPTGLGQSQLQQQQAAGQYNFLPRAPSMANHGRSSIPLQSLPSGVPGSSLPNQLSPDPLVYEEIRLRKEQQNLKLMFEEETVQIKAQYERDAEELRKKYEGLLQNRHRTMEQKNTALKEKLEKVDRNRCLAEALKYRSYLDYPKIRSSNAVSIEVSAGGGQVGHSSCEIVPILGLLQSSQQAMAAATYNVVRNTGSEARQNDPVSPNVPGREFIYIATSNAGSGPSASTIGGVASAIQAGLCLHSPASTLSWQNNTQTSAITMGFATPTVSELSGTLSNCVHGEPLRVSSISLTELDSSLSTESGGVFQNATFRPHPSNPSPPHHTSGPTFQISVQQRRYCMTDGEVSSGFTVPPPAATVECLNLTPSESVPLGAPAFFISRNAGVCPPIVTEAVLVSETPLLSANANLELAVNEVGHGRHINIATDAVSLTELGKEYNCAQTLNINRVSPAAVNLDNGIVDPGSIPAPLNLGNGSVDPHSSPAPVNLGNGIIDPDSSPAPVNLGNGSVDPGSSPVPVNLVNGSVDAGSGNDELLFQLPSLGFDESLVPNKIDFIYISDDD